MEMRGREGKREGEGGREGGREGGKGREREGEGGRGREIEQCRRGRNARARMRDKEIEAAQSRREGGDAVGRLASAWRRSMARPCMPAAADGRTGSRFRSSSDCLPYQ